MHRARDGDSPRSAWLMSEQIFKQQLVLRRVGDSLGSSVRVTAASKEGLCGRLGQVTVIFLQVNS